MKFPVEKFLVALSHEVFYSSGTQLLESIGQHFIPLKKALVSTQPTVQEFAVGVFHIDIGVSVLGLKLHYFLEPIIPTVRSFHVISHFLKQLDPICTPLQHRAFPEREDLKTLPFFQRP